MSHFETHRQTECHTTRLDRHRAKARQACMRKAGLGSTGQQKQLREGPPGVRCVCVQCRLQTGPALALHCTSVHGLQQVRNQHFVRRVTILILSQRHLLRREHKQCNISHRQCAMLQRSSSSSWRRAGGGNTAAAKLCKAAAGMPACVRVRGRHLRPPHLQHGPAL